MSSTLNSSTSPSYPTTAFPLPRARQRPYYEPTLLDYSRYEEGGHMYYALNRHPKSTASPEEWYEETDAHIEHDVLENYQHYVRSACSLAKEEGDEEAAGFFMGLGEVLREAVLEAYQTRTRIIKERFERRQQEAQETKKDSDGTLSVWQWEKEKKQWEATRQKPIGVSNSQFYKDDDGVVKNWLDRSTMKIDPDVYDEIALESPDTAAGDNFTVPIFDDNNGASSILLSAEQTDTDVSCVLGNQDQPTKIEELSPKNPKSNSEEEPDDVVPDWGFNFVFT